MNLLVFCLQTLDIDTRILAVHILHYLKERIAVFFVKLLDIYPPI